MKKSINIGLLTIILSLGFFSCEDFLDRKPLAVIAEESLFSTEQGPLEALMGVYDAFHYFNLDNRIWEVGSAFSDDAVWGGLNGGDGTGMGAAANMLALPTEGRIHWIWRSHFRGIFYANLFLQKLPVSTLPEEVKASYAGEARFIRSLFYFWLAQDFGGLPVMNEPLTISEMKSAPRNSMKEVYEFIEKDLKEAIKALPVQNPSRVTRGAALGLLCKLYVFESSYAKNYPDDQRFAGMKERWDEAINAGEELVSLNSHKLMGLNGEKYNSEWRPNDNALSFIFSKAGNNCAEHLFEIQNGYNGINPYIGPPGGDIGDWMIGEKSGWWNRDACYYLTGTNGKPVTFGVGMNCPTHLFVDFAKSKYNGDARIDTWLVEPGDSTIAKINGLMKYYKYDLSGSPTGYNHRKNEAHPSTQGNNWWEVDLNSTMFRYADVLLLLAEAHYMKGNNAEARKYLNIIRQRARNCGNTGKPAELTGTVTFEDVVNERRMELCFEGQRFFDLVRWRIADEKISGYVTNRGVQVDFIPGKNEFMPIPQSEIDLTDGVLKQNPGY